MTEYAQHQFSIYLQGLAGVKPSLPIAYDDLEAAAREALSPEAFGYVAGGAAEEETMRANREAFRRWNIVPRMMRDIGNRNLSTTVLGTNMPAPVMIAPIGVMSIVHPEAELAVARAARTLQLPMILSTAAEKCIEDVADALGDSPRWYQLYWPDDRALTKSFVQRAEAAGYSAIVITLDTKLLAWRPRDLQNAFLPFLKGQGIGNYTSDPVFREGLEQPPETDMMPAIGKWSELFSDKSVTWDDVSYIRECTQLPIVLKGVLHPDDARLAIEHGVDGVIVSNHGGRQVDGSVGALEMLPEVVDAAAGHLSVLFDSGIRTGSDIIKAVALGADAVLIGRPYVWGLGLAGEAGVEEVLRRLLADFDLSVALCGAKTLSELNADLLRKA